MEYNFLIQFNYVCFLLREREKRNTSNYVATGFHNSVYLARTLNAFWMLCGSNKWSAANWAHQKFLSTNSRYLSSTAPPQQWENIDKKLICNIHSKDILLLSLIYFCLKLNLCCSLCQNNGRKLLAFKFSWDRWMELTELTSESGCTCVRSSLLKYKIKVSVCAPKYIVGNKV